MAYTVSNHCLLDGAAGVVTGAELLSGYSGASHSDGGGGGGGGVAALAKDLASASSGADHTSRGGAGAADRSGKGGSGGGSTLAASSTSVVALCTPKVAFIIRVVPKVELLQRLPAPSGLVRQPDPAQPPLPVLSPRLAWSSSVPSQLVQAGGSEEHRRAPEATGLAVDSAGCAHASMLALAWGMQLQLFRRVLASEANRSAGDPRTKAAGVVSPRKQPNGTAAPASEEARLTRVGLLAFHCPVIGLVWLDGGVLLLLDSQLVIHTVDAALNPLETLPLPTSPLCRPPAPLRVGEAPASVIAASASTATAAAVPVSATSSGMVPTSNAMCCDGRSIYILSKRTLQPWEPPTQDRGYAVLKVRAVSWVEWLSSLANQGRHVDAFVAACELFEAPSDRLAPFPMAAAASRSWLARSVPKKARGGSTGQGGGTLECFGPNVATAPLASLAPSSVGSQQLQQQRDSIASLMGPMVVGFAERELSCVGDGLGNECNAAESGAAGGSAPTPKDDLESSSELSFSGAANTPRLDMESLAAMCTEVLVAVGRLDNLFDQLHDTFAHASPTAYTALLKAMEALLLSRRLTRLPVDRMVEFIREYAQRGWITQLEACLLALDIESVPAREEPDRSTITGARSSGVDAIDQGSMANSGDAREGMVGGAGVPEDGAQATSSSTMATATVEGHATLLQPLLDSTRHLGLHSAYARACSVGAGDYSSPIAVLLEAMQGATPGAFAQDTGSKYGSSNGADLLAGLSWARSRGLPEPVALDAAGRLAAGHTLLLYLRHCLAGFVFPTGERMRSLTRVRSSRRQACAYLFQHGHCKPRLEPLLALDATATLRVLALAFEPLGGEAAEAEAAEAAEAAGAAGAAGAEPTGVDAAQSRDIGSAAGPDALSAPAALPGAAMPSIRRMLATLDGLLLSPSAGRNPTDAVGGEAAVSTANVAHLEGADAHFSRVVIDHFLSSRSAVQAVPYPVLVRAVTCLARRAARYKPDPGLGGAAGHGDDSGNGGSNGGLSSDGGDGGEGDEALLSRLVREARSLDGTPTSAPGTATLLQTLSTLCEDGRLPRVSAALHIRAGRPALALRCCLSDAKRPAASRCEALRLAMASILDPNLTLGARADLKGAILASVAEFDATDRNATVLLLRTALEGESYEGVAATLAVAPLLHLAYVRSLLPRKGGAMGSPPTSVSELGASPPSPSAVARTSAEGIARGQPFELALAALPPAESLPASIHETYLSLLCAHASPAEVRDYLVAHDEYGLDAALKATQQHGAPPCPQAVFHRERIQPLPYPPFDLLNPCVAPLTSTGHNPLPCSLAARSLLSWQVSTRPRRTSWSVRAIAAARCVCSCSGFVPL